MKKFLVSYTFAHHRYKTEIEARNEDSARNKFYKRKSCFASITKVKEIKPILNNLKN